ncbi:hypothetical protein EPO44_08680, partial [bacterium]
MDDRVVEFSHVLRRNGVRVSLSENMDAFRALNLTGLQDAALFRSALRATLIKRTTDLKIFEELFDLFFLGLGAAIREADRQWMSQMGLAPRQFQALLEQVRRLLDRSDGEISPLAQALLAGDMAQVERLLRAAAAADGKLGQSADRLRMTAFSRLAGRLGLSALEQELEDFKSMLSGSGADAETAERILRYVEHRLQELGRMIRDLIKQELQKSGFVDSERERTDYLLQK